MEREWRCSRCGILLAKLGDGSLTIRRNELQATVLGKFDVSVVCYRPRCRTLNVLRIGGLPTKSATTKSSQA
jgi:phage FluMu protein Com